MEKEEKILGHEEKKSFYGSSFCLKRVKWRCAILLLEMWSFQSLSSSFCIKEQEQMAQEYLKKA